MPFIKVPLLNRVWEVKRGENLLEALRREGIEVDSYCGGMGSCGKCVVKVKGEEISSPNSLEEKHLKEKIKEGFRLACQVEVYGEVEVDVSPSLTSYGEVMVKTQEARREELPVCQAEVNVTKPPIDGVSSLQEILSSQLQGKGKKWSLASLYHLSHLGEERETEFEVITDEEKIRYVNKLSSDKSFLGMAFDLGTTTVGGELVDLTTGTSLHRLGALNRQTQFGADVISRLRAIQDDPYSLHRLQELLVQTMNDLIQEACEKVNKNPERVFAVTVAGNTIMEHLFLGVSPLSIGVAPYTPVFREEQVLDARELKIVANPEAQVYLFPSLAGYVGGDILSGVVAFDLIERKGLTLYVDIGTNGEIVLIDGENIFCCGTAAGPAFEGAQIKHGTRATLGAISAVEIKDGDIKIYTIGDLAPRGICGTGLIDALACFLREGLLSPTGRFKENDKWSNRLIKEGGSQAFLLSYDPPIFITQEDISQLQLAKAAIQAGREILLKEAGRKEEEIEEVILAGAFGSFINPESAKTIGLIPQGAKTTSVGNASLYGAKKALLSRDFRRKVKVLFQKARYIELSARSDFSDYFYQSLIFN